MHVLPKQAIIHHKQGNLTRNQTFQHSLGSAQKWQQNQERVQDNSKTQRSTVNQVMHNVYKQTQAPLSQSHKQPDLQAQMIENNHSYTNFNQSLAGEMGNQANRSLQFFHPPSQFEEIPQEEWNTCSGQQTCFNGAVDNQYEMYRGAHQQQQKLIKGYMMQQIGKQVEAESKIPSAQKQQPQINNISA